MRASLGEEWLTLRQGNSAPENPVFFFIGILVCICTMSRRGLKQTELKQRALGFKQANASSLSCLTYEVFLFYYSSSCVASATHRAHTPLPMPAHLRCVVLAWNRGAGWCGTLWQGAVGTLKIDASCPCLAVYALLLIGCLAWCRIVLVLRFADHLSGEGLGAAPDASSWGLQPLQHQECGSARSRAWWVRSCGCQQSRASPAARSQQEGCGSDLRSGVLLFGSLRKKALSCFLLLNKASSCCSLLICGGKQGTFEIIHKPYEIHSRTSTLCPVARLCSSPGRGELYCSWIRAASA